MASDRWMTPAEKLDAEIANLAPELRSPSMFHAPENRERANGAVRGTDERRKLAIVAGVCSAVVLLVFGASILPVRCELWGVGCDPGTAVAVAPQSPAISSPKSISPVIAPATPEYWKRMAGCMRQRSRAPHAGNKREIRKWCEKDIAGEVAAEIRMGAMDRDSIPSSDPEVRTEVKRKLAKHWFLDECVKTGQPRDWCQDRWEIHERELGE